MVTSTMMIRSIILLGSGIRPRGEQVPERGAPAEHLRQERGRVGQAGALGHTVPRALQQRALAHTDTAAIVSIYISFVCLLVAAGRS